MISRVKFYQRIVAMALVFTILFPMMPFKYIDLRFRNKSGEI
jgi:hypothetical protein